MRKPRAVIINETPEGKENLTTLLKGLIKTGGKAQALVDGVKQEVDIEGSGLDFEIIDEDNVSVPLRKNSKLLPGTIYFIREDPKNPKLESQIAKELTEKGADNAKVLTTERLKPYAETTTAEGHEHFSGWIPKRGGIFDVGEVSRKVEELRKDEKLSQRVTLGVIGLGKLGRQILSVFKSQSHIASVHAFSEFAKNDYEKEIIPRMAFEGDQRRKFHFHGNLEAVIQANPDQLVISTGEFRVPYDNYDKIRDLTGRLMVGAYPKVRRILQAVKDAGYNGTILMEANPTGALLQVAKRMGIDPSILTSITPDMSRHKTLLLEKLSAEDPSLQYSDIDLTVIGEHGKEIPLLREARVRGELLTNVFPEFKKASYRMDFINEAREIGLRGIKISEKLGDNYGGTPDKIVEYIKHFASFGRTIPSAYSYFVEADCFIGAPSIIDYPLKVKSVSQSLRGLSQDKEVLAGLGKDIGYQIALTNKHHPKPKA